MSEYEPFMRRTLELAARGQGWVEPNPMVGAVVVRGGRIVAEGYHERFGGPHAEVNALARCAQPAGTTLVVSLEPCCHQGKTPPCTQAIVKSRVTRVVVGCQDPFPAVAGKGLDELRQAGVEVVTGVLEAQARALNAPYFKLRTRQLPYIIAKWAMTLDGRIATATGDSRWISGEKSRRWVHDLRGRVDAIVVGIGTVLKDDPMLTCRTEARRVATRVILDEGAETPISSQLVRTAREVPVLVAVTDRAPETRRQALRGAGVEVLLVPADAAGTCDIGAVMQELGRRECTNVLVEGGGAVLGSAFDAGLVDEVAVFVAPRVVGGAGAVAPVAGRGVARIARAWRLTDLAVTRIGRDVLIRGHVAAPERPPQIGETK